MTDGTSTKLFNYMAHFVKEWVIILNISIFCSNFTLEKLFNLQKYFVVKYQECQCFWFGLDKDNGSFFSKSSDTKWAIDVMNDSEHMVVDSRMQINLFQVCAL